MNLNVTSLSGEGIAVKWFTVEDRLVVFCDVYVCVGLSNV